MRREVARRVPFSARCRRFGTAERRDLAEVSNRTNKAINRGTNKATSRKRQPVIRGTEKMTNPHIPADIPQAVMSEYAIYTEAVEKEHRKDRRSKIAICTLAVSLAVATVASLGGIVIATSTNLELAKVAATQPVRYVERGPDGIDRVIAVRNTMDVDKGREMETLVWFVTWSRWVSSEAAVTKTFRASAKAKLAGDEALNRWLAITKDDCDPKDGCVRDVLGVVVAEQEIRGLETGKRNYQLSWQEKTLRNGKVTSDATMTMNVTIIQGPPREGSLDGVNIVLLTEPTPHVKQRIASN
jgi:type IV secretory pathway TrbF-like protein